jgi:hypothetical protein
MEYLTAGKEINTFPGWPLLSSENQEPGNPFAVGVSFFGCDRGGWRNNRSPSAGAAMN